MSSAYWEHRAALRQAAYDRANNKVVESVSRAYDRTMRQLDKDIDTIMATYTRKTGLSPREAYDFLRDGVPQSVMDDLSVRISQIADPKQQKKLSVMLRTDAYRARISRLDAIKASTRVGLTEAAEAELGAITPHLRHTAELAYNRTMFDIQKVTAGFEMVGVPRKALDTILKSRWSGMNYAQSVWANRDAMAGILDRALMEQASMGKLSQITFDNVRGIVDSKAWADKVAAGMKSKFKSEMQYSKYAANRLIRTESAYVAGQTTAVAYDECGIERYEYMATLDSRTSEKCSGLDGKIFEMSEKEVGVNYPPAHPHCRSSVAPVIDGLTREGLTRAARDKNGKSVYVPRDMKYQEWQAWQDAGCPSDIQGWRNRNNLDKALSTVEKTNKGLDYEIATIFNNRGDVVQTFTGGAENVLLQTSAMKDNVVTHNHPKGGALSVGDLQSFVVSGARELRATTPWGRYASIKRARGTVDPQIIIEYKNSDAMSARKTAERLSDAIEKGEIDRKHYEENPKKVISDVIEANSSKWFRENAEAYGVLYEDGDL